MGDLEKLDEIAEDFVIRHQRERREAAERRASRSRKKGVRPHEAKRKARQISVTFPSAGWKERLQALADERGLRLSDLVTWLISVAMAEVEAGRQVPSGKGREAHHRSGAFLDLPWQPEGGD